MKCPHCLENFHVQWRPTDLIMEEGRMWRAEATICPNCSKATIKLSRYNPTHNNTVRIGGTLEFQAYPKGIARSALPKEVPDEYAEDYREACLVLTDSPKASAALSRRCLQHLLQGPGQAKSGDLSKQIQQVLDAKLLPTYLAEAIDGVRNYGNFAAHPTKSQNTGTIVSVEPGEADWLLEVLEGLFDFYFVQPARFQAHRQALDIKLADAGKQPMKQPTS